MQNQRRVVWFYKYKCVYLWIFFYRLHNHSGIKMQYSACFSLIIHDLLTFPRWHRRRVVQVKVENGCTVTVRNKVDKFSSLQKSFKVTPAAATTWMIFECTCKYHESQRLSAKGTSAMLTSVLTSSFCRFLTNTFLRCCAGFIKPTLQAWSRNFAHPHTVLSICIFPFPVVWLSLAPKSQTARQRTERTVSIKLVTLILLIHKTCLQVKPLVQWCPVCPQPCALCHWVCQSDPELVLRLCHLVSQSLHQEWLDRERWRKIQCVYVTSLLSC